MVTPIMLRSSLVPLWSGYKTSCSHSPGGKDKLHAHVIKLTFHSLVDRDIQEVCGSSRILTALVLKFAGAGWGTVALLTSDLMLNT